MQFLHHLLESGVRLRGSDFSSDLWGGLSDQEVERSGICYSL